MYIASKEQPHILRLKRLFVGANREGKGLDFLDKIVRHFWDGSQPGWDKGSFIAYGQEWLGLHEEKLLTAHQWASVEFELNANHSAMLESGRLA